MGYHGLSAASAHRSSDDRRHGDVQRRDTHRAVRIVLEDCVYAETTMVMHGDRARIFALGAAIEDWPRILPHYRAVDLAEKTEQPDGTIRKVATMKAWRVFPVRAVRIPVFWRTIQEVNVATDRLHFFHIGGFTRGMDVYWRLTPEAGGATRVTITHDFVLRWPLVGEFVAHRIVGDLFVDAIARRTLATIKGIVEAEATRPTTGTGAVRA